MTLDVLTYNEIRRVRNAQNTQVRLRRTVPMIPKGRPVTASDETFFNNNSTNESANDFGKNIVGLLVEGLGTDGILIVPGSIDADASGSVTQDPLDTTEIDLSDNSYTVADPDGKELRYYTVDDSNYVWAVALRAPHGLWKRDPSNGTWAEELSDSADGQIWVLENGTIYYKDSNGNYFTLASGSASTASAPTNEWDHNGFGFDFTHSNHLSYQMMLSNDRFQIKSLDGSTAGNVYHLPIDGYRRMWDDGDSINVPSDVVMRLDNTYALIVLSSDSNFARQSYILFNMNDKTFQYLGETEETPVGYPRRGGGFSTLPQAARIDGSVLSLYQREGFHWESTVNEYWAYCRTDIDVKVEI